MPHGNSLARVSPEPADSKGCASAPAAAEPAADDQGFSSPAARRAGRDLWQIARQKEVTPRLTDEQRRRSSGGPRRRSSGSFGFLSSKEESMVLAAKLDAASPPSATPLQRPPASGIEIMRGAVQQVMEVQRSGMSDDFVEEGDEETAGWTRPARHLLLRCSAPPAASKECEGPCSR